MGVYISRFEGPYIWSGPQGLRDPVLRLERSLRGLRRAVEHVAEGQGNNRGTSRGGDGLIKILQSLNLVIGPITSS
jgi:hypothetical protein